MESYVCYPKLYQIKSNSKYSNIIKYIISIFLGGIITTIKVKNNIEIEHDENPTGYYIVVKYL